MVFPRNLSQYVSSFYKQKGIELWAGERIVALEARGYQHVLKTVTKREIVVDGVVAGIGLEPNIELAQSAGLKTDKGIVLDEFLRARPPDIYAAGDVAAFHSPVLGKRIRVEHEDNANSMGRSAGRNMAVSMSRTIICLPSNPTCSSWDTKRSVWGQVQAARQLIAEPGPFTPKDLERLLPVRSKA